MMDILGASMNVIMSRQVNNHEEIIAALQLISLQCRNAAHELLVAIRHLERRLERLEEVILHKRAGVIGEGVGNAPRRQPFAVDEWLPQLGNGGLREDLFIPEDSIPSSIIQEGFKRARDAAGRIDRGEDVLLPIEVAKQLCRGDQSRLYIIRRWRGLTQEELAEMVGSTKSYISQLENHRRYPGPKMLHRLAHALNVPVHVIMEERDNAADSAEQKIKNCR